MIYSDLRNSPVAREMYDVCVVGGGPAGITLARRLAGHNLRVLLMEAGGLEITSRSQELYEGDNIGLEYYDAETARLRFFGGSSNHWGGRCRALDAHDFRSKPFHPLSGWPITKEDLDAYAEDADDILQLAPASSFANRTVRFGDMRAEEIFYRHSPVYFNEKYQEEIAASDGIHLVLNANLVDLKLGDNLNGVETAVFRSYDPESPDYGVSARYYCLCMGGLENPRFLLNARSQIPVGLGNEHDLVGRFFLEHPHFVIGDVLFRDRVPETRNYTMDMAFQTEREILNFAVRVVTDQLNLPREISRAAICSTSFTERLATQVLGRHINCDFGGVKQYFQNRRAVADHLSGVIQINTEQSLNANSRIRLSQERDALGLQRIAVDWHLSDLDFRTMRTAGELIGQRLARADIGRVRLHDWLMDRDLPLPGTDDGMVGGHHHMCTTRMSDNPREGVVDRNCRVHGVGNLYIGGSSVFATAGHANPTYSIVQLALRLGDHLAHAVKSPGAVAGQEVSRTVPLRQGVLSH